MCEANIPLKGFYLSVYTKHRYYFAFVNFRLGKRLSSLSYIRKTRSPLRLCQSPVLSASLYMLVAFNLATNAVEKMETVYRDRSAFM